MPSLPIAELSEVDGDVFDLSFVRPKNHYVLDSAVMGVECGEGGDGGSSCTCPADLGDAARPVEVPLLAEHFPSAVVADGLLRDEEVAVIDQLLRTSLPSFVPVPRTGVSAEVGNTNCPTKAVICTPPAFNEHLFRRLAPLLPPNARGINARWRLYHYPTGARLSVHKDRGEYPSTSVAMRGDETEPHVVFDDGRFGEGAHSCMSLLIYLSGDGTVESGGETIFYHPRTPEAAELNLESNGDDDVLAEHFEAVPVASAAGRAVAFYHGEHDDSPWHEGALVRSGTKLIVRTDIIFAER
jgi:hypothetical protein